MSKALLTKPQREREERNRRIYDYYAAEIAKGSAKMLIYEKLSKRYSLTKYQVGRICKRYERVVA